MPRHENYPQEYQKSILSGVGSRDALRADSLDWNDLAKFRDIWPGILMIKGVNRPEDAVKAIEYGVDGIIVSNHGGRNMDSAAATIDVLPEVAEAVGNRATVILDSGVRRGSDIAKALALGAKAVLTGRATLYGTAVGGEAGALRAISLIRNEFDKTMAYTGCCTVDELSPDIFYRRARRQPPAWPRDGHGIKPALLRAFHREWKTQPTLSLRGAERRSNLLPDERTSARQAGDCFVAPRLAMTAWSGASTSHRRATSHRPSSARTPSPPRTRSHCSPSPGWSARSLPRRAKGCRQWCRSTARTVLLMHHEILRRRYDKGTARAESSMRRDHAIWRPPSTNRLPPVM